MANDHLLTRDDLRRRWGCSLAMIDRARKHCLPWIDVSGSRGSRPSVRFRLVDIEQYELEQRHSADEGETEATR